MPEQDLHLGAAVYSSDGRHVGKLASVITDNDAREEDELVVQESRVFSGHLLSPGTLLMVDELLVPARAVSRVVHDRIDLNLTSAQVRRLPPYLTYHYQQPTRMQVLQELMAASTASAGVAPIAADAHKPRAEIEIDPGENVMLGRTGKRLGRVSDVLIDDGEVVGVVIERGLLEHEFILPVRFLDRSDDLALFAHLTEEDLGDLKPFHPDQSG